MKYYITLLIIGLSFFKSFSQIGILTDNPLTVFHIDGLSNNTSNSNNYKDDVAFEVANNNNIVMGIGTVPNKNTSSQLDLGGGKSALLLNRVLLNNYDDKEVFDVAPKEGTIVYNAINNDNIESGLYFYQDSLWNPVSSRSVASQIKYLNLAATVAAITNGQAYINPLYSNYLTWVDPTIPNAQASSLITVPETSSYAFTVRLWGQRPRTTADARIVIYIWLLKDGLKQAASVLDVAELNVPVPTGVATYSYSVTLSASFQAGDKVSISIGAPATATMNPGSMLANVSAGVNPNKTSVLYWKLD